MTELAPRSFGHFVPTHFAQHSGDTDEMREMGGAPGIFESTIVTFLCLRRGG